MNQDLREYFDNDSEESLFQNSEDIQNLNFIIPFESIRIDSSSIYNVYVVMKYHTL